jgi:hypothetical protein
MVYVREKATFGDILQLALAGNEIEFHNAKNAKARHCRLTRVIFRDSKALQAFNRKRKG